MSKKKPSDENPDKWREFAENEDEQLDETEEALEFPSRSKLENQLTAMEKKVEQYQEKALRAQADMENTRRRAEREISNAHKYGAEKLLLDLLPVVDSLIRALESPDSSDPHVKSMRKGIELTLDLLHKTLSQHGVGVIDPKKGDVFNPDLHEAMSAQEDPKAKTNTILQVIQKGYELNGRVLRAAMVMVAR